MTTTDSPNYTKQSTYASIHAALTKAIRYEFYYEAIFLEYAILEDRFISVLKAAGIDYHRADGRDVPISKKISLINGRKELSDKFYKKRLTPELMKQCESWIDTRNDLIHHLANAPYDDERVKQLALEGNDLVRVVENKVKSCVTHLKKESAELAQS